MAGRALKIGLFASVVVNAFLAAAFIAALMFAGYIARNPAAPTIRHAARSLDPPHRAAFIAVLRAQGRALRPANQEARALRQQVWAAMQSPEFDAAAAKTNLAQARALTLSSREKVEDAVVDFAASLPADQRAALGKALAGGMRRPPAVNSRR
jgi:uncharacterized membrane protein